jgi:His/Glu/Gln/Arg/opine family amino acid ABC transporter permease subunit
MQCLAVTSLTHYLDPLLRGIPMTLAVTTAAFALAVIGGMPLFALRRSRLALVRLPVTFLIDLIRAIPQIAWLFLIYYGLAQQGFRLGAFAAAIVALGIFSAAHMAEIYRAGLMAVDRGQWEAGRAIGLGELRLWTEVLAPQALRVVVPPSTSYLINLLKDSAVASVIGVSEITFHAHEEAQATFNGLTVFALAALIYIAISVPLAGFSRSMDKRLRAAFQR